MGADRATNIKINIDIKNAVAKLDTVSNKMKSMGGNAQTAGTQVRTGMNQATTAIKKTGDQSAASAIQFSTMANGMLNLSTSAVQTYTSISNLARAENRAKATAVSLERAEDLLARKQLQLNKIVEAGGKGGRDYALILGEIETAENDLAVKTEKLKIEQEAVTDVYMLFAANIANVGVSSLMVYKTMTEGLTKAKVLEGLVTKKNIITEKLAALARWNSSKSLLGLAATSATATGGLVAQTLATRVATAATKALNIALGPVGWIIIGISAALVAYETNFRGFKDSVNGFLGIQTEFNEGVEEGTGSIDEQTAALTAQTKAFKDLSTPMQNYITMQEDMARSTGNASEIIRLAKLRATGGFSSGVGSPQIASGNGGTGSGGSYASSDIAYDQSGSTQQQFSQGKKGFNVGYNTAYADNNTQVNQKIQSRQPALASQFDKNPFGTIDQKVAFYELNPPQQRDVLVSWIDNTWDNPGMQNAFIDKYHEIFDLTNGFTIKKIEAASPVDNLAGVLDLKALGVRGGGGNVDKSVFAAGFGGNGSIFNFKEKDVRKMIKDALGVDVGAVSGTFNITDAIRKGVLTKVGQSFSGIGGRDTEMIAAFGGNATQAYQTARGPGISARAKAENALADFMANSGLGNRIKAAGNIFGITQPLGVGYRSSVPSPIGWQVYDTTVKNAKILGQDEESRIGMANALAQFEKDASRHGKDNIHVINRYYMATMGVAAARMDRVSSMVSSALGVDFDANSKTGYWGRVLDRKGRPTFKKRWISTAGSIEEQVRADIGASADISLPSASRLEALAHAFNENGSFSNFDNISITGEAVEKLGITEQKIFDIRFEATRGDRELLNRIRYIEKIEASSSGTSPL